MKTWSLIALLTLSTTLLPSVADAAKPKPGTKKYLAEEAAQRLGFDALAAVYTVVAPVGMIEGSIASDIPYAPVRSWGESMMSKSVVANVGAEQMLALGLTGKGVADPNEAAKVVPVKYDIAPDAGRLKRFGVQLGTRVFAGVGGLLYTAVMPVTMMVGSIATLLPSEAAKSWGRSAISQSVYGAKVSQNLIAIALAGKMVDVPNTLYPIHGHAWGWDDGRNAPTKTAPAPTTAGTSASSPTSTPQRPPVGIAPGTHVSLPGGANGGFHH